VDNHLTIQLSDYSMMAIACVPGIRNELSEYFSFFVPGYKFMSAYKSRIWDGKIRLFNNMTCEINTGLYHKVLEFAKDRAYTVEIKPSKYGIPGAKNKVEHQNLVKFIDSLELPYEVKNYQYEALCHGIENKRCVLVSPTGSGKSLIIYTLMRWYLENHDKKVLVIVPTTNLVEQMRKDFCDYGFDKDEIHIIYSGKEKDTSERVVISTWQSIHILSSKWFQEFGCIFGDECHGFKAKSLSSIMNKATEAEYRFGATGTLDGTQTHKLVLEGLFGPVKKVTTTKKLQEENSLAQLKIELLIIEYPSLVRKEFGYKTYQEEMDFIVKHEGRNKFIQNLAISQKGNTLVLFQYVEKHGHTLHTMIKNKCKETKNSSEVYYVHGATGTSDRESIRAIVEKSNGAIIVASLGTFSTGINIKNLHNIIFASPSKSQIRVLQSIGRGLRKSDDGSTTKLYDIADDLHWEDRKNFTLLHSVERVKIYKKEQFDYTMQKVKLK